MIWRKFILRALFFLLVVPALLFGLYTWGTLRFVYSSGERAGYLQKFSKKGWLCKTWEGEIALVNLPGAAPEMFAFTIRDPKVVEQMQANLGQRVSVTYDQHRGIPTTCFGETQYFATAVRPVQDANPPAPLLK